MWVYLLFLLLKSSPSWPAWYWKAMSPCTVILSTKKHCWLFTHTSSSCWHFIVPKTDRMLQESSRPCRQMGRRINMPGKWDVLQGLSNWAWILTQESNTAIWAGCLHAKLKGCPIASPQQHGLGWIRHLAFMWCLYGQSTILTLPN